MYQAILFDLDGTLLPMEQDVFVKHYFRLLAQKLAPHGYDPKALISAIWEGTEAMVRNQGGCTNEEAFWRCFCHRMGEDARKDEPIFEEYYRKEFQAVQQVCGFAPEAARVIATVKEMGIPIVLATNPIFPQVATHSRIRWAGLNSEDFALVTTYENSRFCKPNPDYYRSICETCSLEPQKCLMVGNDAQEDLVARELGMEVFLLTDCLIDRKGTDLTAIPHGNFADLISFLSRQ